VRSVVLAADGETTHGFGEEGRDVTHLRGTGCRGWVEGECCSHILFVLGLHTEEHEDQWIEVGVESAECLPPSEMVPAAKTESVAGGRNGTPTTSVFFLLLFRRPGGGDACRRSSSRGECLPGLSWTSGSRRSFDPERGEAASDVRLDRDAQMAVAVRRLLCGGVL
jgi:hypothetical protein